MFFPERISAIAAVELGISTKVLPHDELMSYAKEQALNLIPPLGAAMSIREMKRIMHQPLTASLNEALDLENEALAKLMGTEDFAEGMMARVERRPPVFKGK